MRRYSLLSRCSQLICDPLVGASLLPQAAGSRSPAHGCVLAGSAHSDTHLVILTQRLPFARQRLAWLATAAAGLCMAAMHLSEEATCLRCFAEYLDPVGVSTPASCRDGCGWDQPDGGRSAGEYASSPQYDCTDPVRYETMFTPSQDSRGVVQHTCPSRDLHAAVAAQARGAPSCRRGSCRRSTRSWRSWRQ